MIFNYAGIREQTIIDISSDIKKIMQLCDLNFIEAAHVYEAAFLEDFISDLFLDDSIGLGRMDIVINKLKRVVKNRK